MFALNGVNLGAATTLITDQGMQASDLKNWIKHVIDTDNRLTGFEVSAQNNIKIPAEKIDLKLSVTLNASKGQPVTFPITNTTSYASIRDLANAINDAKETTKVVASVDSNGDLVLGNLLNTEGDNIIVSTVLPNALGIAADTYRGSISVTRALIKDVDTPVELGFYKDPGSQTTLGTPADLAKLGFKTGAYIKGSANEDLLVFVTGNGDAKVSSSYQGALVDPKESLRKQTLGIKFSSESVNNVKKNYYTVTDTQTQTELAKREVDTLQPEFFVSYQGLKIGFSSPPQDGDTFTVDGNKDGTGNNENMLALANLENKKVMGGGKTLGAYYIDHVNDMGNIARQAAISQSALQVVYDQAVTARDEVSGVSLDQEAADLIRFQQAYQAAAKILQVASQLFDSVLQVR
jgi:flagellar hook-associated protein FlgK